MDNWEEKNVIMETNRINPHPGEEFVGALLRQIGSKWRPFVYAKKGIFLEEFRPNSNRLSDFPREVLDLTSMKIDSKPVVGLTKNEIPRAFRVIARNGKVLQLMASSIEEKNAWTKALTDEEVENLTRPGVPKSTSIIAPVRRRQISIETLKRKAFKKVARVECDPQGFVTRYNDTAEHIFGYTSVEMVGKKITILMPDSVVDKHEGFFSTRRSQIERILGKYRVVKGKRKDGEEFEIHIKIEATVEGNYLAIMAEVNPYVDQNYLQEVNDEYKMIQNLRVKVVEAKELAGPSPSKKAEKIFDTYCVILIDQEKKSTTSTKNSTTTPFWSEEFFFDDIGNQAKMLRVVINNQNKASQKDPRHGHVVIDLKSLINGRPLEKWYGIMPVKSEDDPSKTLGSIRIKATLISEKILPFQEYSELYNLVLDDELTIFNALASAAGSQLEEIAGTLVNIFAMENRVTEFVRNLTVQEVERTSDPNVLFRANSLTTKVIDIYMKVVGMTFLHSVLTDLVLEIYESKESCEIDPTRLEKGDDLEMNAQRLLLYVNRFFAAISASVDRLPPELACVFENIRVEVSKKWPENEVEKYTSISGFIFLRFFCPAILDPNLFGIMDEHPTGGIARTLTLIAKTLQSLSNLVEAGVEKEPFMEKVNPFIKDHHPKVKTVINKFCVPSSRDPNKFEKVDQTNLRRELSALYRYFSDRLAQLKENAQKSEKKAEVDPKTEKLFKVIENLDERHKVFDSRLSDTVKRSSAQVPHLRIKNELIYDGKLASPS